MLILVTGAGGFIGGHLVGHLLHDGYEVVAVDKKPVTEWYQLWDEAHSYRLDLSDPVAARSACEGVNHVYNLAADMGGMGFISGHKAECMLSVLISTNMLQAAKEQGVQRFFYSSSACVYPGFLQDTEKVDLKESDAYPADPEDGYGWEKLFSERMARHFYEDFGLETRVARYHNSYGPFGTYEGGREKAPAAICRKVIEAKLTKNKTIEIWGDGEQTRSFMYVNDCVIGTTKLMASDFRDPLNIGSSELVTINELVSVAEEIAGVKLRRVYNMDAPQGVRGRNSENTLCRKVLGWEPQIKLADGLERTYAWIWDQMSGKAKRA